MIGGLFSEIADKSFDKIIREDIKEINPYSIEQQVKEQILSLRIQLLQLDKYRNEWGYIVENSNGEYIKLEDVLALFSAEK